MAIHLHKTLLYASYSSLWHSCFRIFITFRHHDSKYVPISLSANNKTSKIYAGHKYLLLCFNCASQRLTEFQFRKDSFGFL